MQSWYAQQYLRTLTCHPWVLVLCDKVVFWRYVTVGLGGVGSLGLSHRWSLVSVQSWPLVLGHGVRSVLGLWCWATVGSWRCGSQIGVGLDL